MSVIDTLITDRTQNDVINDLDKAYNAYTDLNRIEEACEYVAGELNISITTKTDWVATDMRYASEMERIRTNIATLRAVYAKSTTPTVPTEINFKTITQANNIEKILYDIDEMYQNVMSAVQRLSFVLGRKTIGNRR